MEKYGKELDIIKIMIKKYINLKMEKGLEKNFIIMVN